MIYFLDNSLQLQKVVTSKNINSAVHVHELNGLIRGDIELDLSYANKFLVLGIDHVGYYYNDEFYLHKIQRVKYDHVNESVKVVFRHIFFEDMLFGPIIKDVRPKNQDAVTILRQTIEANTRWQIVMTDVTGTLSTNFYWQVPYEVIEFVNKTFRVDMFPKILFDGKNINGFQLHVKNASSSEVKQRIPFGSRVLDLKYEEDFSEIVTKLVGHGKGEEVGDGYGRRINFSEINFNRNGVKSPVGSVYMEDPSVTNAYGNDGQTPREGRIVFEDIESPSDLAEATYQHYLEVSRPQMLFTADVADIGDVSIGDSVLIIRREYDVYFKARIHKLSVNLLYPEDAQVELGDYEHFKESTVERKAREKNNRIQNQLSDRIARLKREANDFIDGEFSQALSEFEQNLIDQKAEIEADRENMTNLINEKTKEFDESLAAGMEEAERKRQENYEAISDHINTTVDTSRSELEDSINKSIDSAKSYAEQQAQEKSDAVKSELETVTNGHQQMLEDLESNVMSIDDFIGNKTVSLNEMLYNERMLLEERINSINIWHYNLLRETKSLDSRYWEALSGTIEMDVNGDSYYKSSVTNSVQRVLRSKQPYYFEPGETYTLTFEVKTYGQRAMDYIWIINRDPEDSKGNFWLSPNADDTNADVIHFSSEYRRYYITFTMPRGILGDIQIGGDYRNNELGVREYSIKKPYLTQSDNKQWLYNQEDSLQNIEEITRRVTLLEDGREEFITRAQYNNKTGEIEGSIKSVLETVDESSLIIQNHENWILTNGASIERTVDGFDSKAWLADIHNPNMIPFSAVNLPEHRANWIALNAPAIGTSYGDWVHVRNANSGTVIGYESPSFSVVEGEKYTISFEAAVNNVNANADFNYMYLMYRDSGGANQGSMTPVRKNTGQTVAGNQIYKYTLTFTADRNYDKASVLFGTRTTSGTDTGFRMRHPKMELGADATPYNNAFSSLSQRADELSLSVQGIGERGFLNQSDIIVRPDFVQIGSQQINGDSIASLLRVSPTGIDVVAEAMRLSGDLYVDGDITALAVKAIEGNFAKLFATELEATTINVDMIYGKISWFEEMIVNSAVINKLVTNELFSNEVTAKVGNYIDLNAGNIVTAGLSANVIEADHIQVGTQLVDKMFATSARIDQLITKSHFVNEMHALTLNVVDLNASHIRSRLLTANVIEAEWLKGGTALLDRVFSSTAMFERMMAKSGFVTTLNTVTIDTDLLTVRRKDGIAWIRDGMPRFDIPVQVQQYLDKDVEFDGQRYITNNRGASIVSMLYTSHAGRYLRIGVTTGLHYSAKDNQTQMAIVIRPQGQPGSAMVKEIRATRTNSYYVHEFDMGPPTFGAMSYSLEFYRIGDNVNNPVTMRIHRAWVSG